MRSSLFRALAALAVACLLALLQSASPAGAAQVAAVSPSARVSAATTTKPLPLFHIVAPLKLVYRRHRYYYVLRSLEMKDVKADEFAYWNCIRCGNRALLTPGTVRTKNTVRFHGFDLEFRSHTGLEEYVLQRKGRNVTARIGRIEEAQVFYSKRRQSYTFNISVERGCVKPILRDKKLRRLTVVTCPGATKSGSSGTTSSTGTGSSAPTSGSGTTSGSSSSSGSPAPVIAAPTATTYNFTANLGGTGAGTLTGSGITCSGSTCTGSGTSGQVITLTAAPKPGSTFTGWSGACTTSSTNCSFVLSGDSTVTATFALNQETVTVARAGSGSGTVTGTGISCGSTCSTSVGYGQPETLTATAATGSSFSGWSGGCTGTSTCTVSPTAASSVTATFTINMETLSVNRSGPGGGSVSGSGISCGGTCSIAVPYGTVVSLSPSYGWDLQFNAWQGAGCSGTGGCSITMTSNQTVGAPFSGYFETPGSAANTWTDYADAGGTEGPQVPKGETIQVSCVVQGFRVSDGNTNWYRIASSPWNSQYYVSADAFYNNGATSGSLTGTPFVDPAVPGC